MYALSPNVTNAISFPDLHRKSLDLDARLHSCPLSPERK